MAMETLDRHEEQRRREAALRGLLAKDEDRWRLKRSAKNADPNVNVRNRRSGKKVSAAKDAKRRGARKTWVEKMEELRRKPRPHPAGCRRLIIMRWPDETGLELQELRTVYDMVPEYDPSSVRWQLCALRREGLIENLAGPQERASEGFAPFVGKPRYVITDAGLVIRAEWIAEFGD